MKHDSSTFVVFFYCLKKCFTCATDFAATVVHNKHIFYHWIINKTLFVDIGSRWNSICVYFHHLFQFNSIQFNSIHSISQLYSIFSNTLQTCKFALSK
ncbi:hypothetical protein T4E_7247 [Trichinella pseudospiralis]|uniref:Uncharacterized protein n=1 Tax=Trichinella pseudospiralis TaxID=6337 RepID=A0A0V0YCQ5_TRIPS|nr:hypothetical protein T4E_7247 [Trichinella pseudospiralis]